MGSKERYYEDKSFWKKAHAIGGALHSFPGSRSPRRKNRGQRHYSGEPSGSFQDRQGGMAPRSFLKPLSDHLSSSRRFLMKAGRQTRFGLPSVTDPQRIQERQGPLSHHEHAEKGRAGRAGQGRHPGRGVQGGRGAGIHPSASPNGGCHYQAGVDQASGPSHTPASCAARRSLRHARRASQRRERKVVAQSRTGCLLPSR